MAVNVAALRFQIETALAGRVPAPFAPRPVQVETAPFRIAEVDALTGGLPRGGLTEICGPPCSGRATLLLSALASGTAHRGGLRAGGWPRQLRSAFGRGCRRKAGAIALGAVRQYRPVLAGHGPSFARRRLRADRSGLERSGAENRALRSAQRVVPFSARGGKYVHDFAACGSGVERRDLRLAGFAAGFRARALGGAAGAASGFSDELLRLLAGRSANSGAIGAFAPANGGGSAPGELKTGASRENRTRARRQVSERRQSGVTGKK